MNFTLGNYTYLVLLILLPILAGVISYYLKWQREKTNAFAENRFYTKVFGKEKKSGFVPFLYLFAFLFLIFAMIDLLAGNEKITSKQKVSNVMFLLDVSNSMNAQDVEPSRLHQAKNIIQNTLPKLGGDRIGLVVFAGNATSVMPLTTDLSAAETYISGIETSAVKVQGTDFLKAMEVAVKKFKSVPKGARQVVILSDGEDNEGNENEAISLAQEEGITVSTIGIGTDTGAPVPEYFYGQLMGYKTDIYGETIITKKQEEALKNIAQSTGGIYIGGNNLDNAIAQITQHLKTQKGNSYIEVDSQNSEHYYQYFLAISLFLFFIIYLFNPKKDLNL